MKEDIQENLFQAELEVMRSAKADLENVMYRDNKLLPRYITLIEQYHKLLRTTQKIFRISDNQGCVLQQHQVELQNLLDNSSQGFLTFGRDLLVDQRYSAECARIFGRRIGGVSIVRLLCQGGNDNLSSIFERSFSCPEEERQPFLQQLPSTFKINARDINVECKSISPPLENGDNLLLMMILTDITDKLRAEAQILYLSHHDKLTSLYNRAYVEQVLPDLQRPEFLPLSIIMLDMNGLKLANDVFGHQQGDRMLVTLSHILLDCCRQTDIIARWGGDEFLILLPKTDRHVCLKVCDRIRKACADSPDNPIPLSAAIGAATKDAGVASLSEMFGVAETRMYNDKMSCSREVRKNIITSMESTLHDRCFENEGHCERVLALALKFVDYLNLDLDTVEVKRLQQLAALHDIGKVTIPREILGKPGPLTSSELEIVKSHSDIGYRMAQSIGDPILADLILALHERWDGTGYPLGLKEDQIPLLARLFSLVDVYDVMTHERPYNEILTDKVALKELSSAKGSQFDPELTEQFCQFIPHRYRT